MKIKSKTNKQKVQAILFLTDSSTISHFQTGCDKNFTNGEAYKNMDCGIFWNCLSRRLCLRLNTNEFYAILYNPL